MIELPVGWSDLEPENQEEADYNLYLVAPIGFKLITSDELAELLRMSYLDRRFCDLVCRLLLH